MKYWAIFLLSLITIWSCAPGSSIYTTSSTPTTIEQPQSTPTPTPTDERVVQRGHWGGRGIMMIVRKTNSVYELDCAHGTIDEALKLNSENRFHAQGKITIEHGGPVRPGEVLPTYPATYDGIAAGIIMDLTIQYQANGQSNSQTYHLVFNQDPRLTKCL